MLMCIFQYDHEQISTNSLDEFFFCYFVLLLLFYKLYASEDFKEEILYRTKNLKHIKMVNKNKVH